jgi:hypothetical protein
MNESLDRLICRHVFDTQSLIKSHPPQIRNANKKIVHQIACPPDSIHQGQLIFSRWQAMKLPNIIFSQTPEIEVEEYNGFFEYQPVKNNSHQVEWYLNFAHFDLFCCYGGGLLAQDEMQVAEHPALASLREALLSANIKPLTVENGIPTPVLIRGVGRRCAIDTNPDPEKDRPFGLYGNNFARASAEAIRLATEPLQPPTITNIIAMEAPSEGDSYSSYEFEVIEYILTTAFTGFSAAKIESQLENQEPIVVIHTGFWGCGAYGGNRVLMALLQLIAARLAQIDKLIFHTNDAIGSQALATAQGILQQYFVGVDVNMPGILDKIYVLAFKWGTSDGN